MIIVETVMAQDLDTGTGEVNKTHPSGGSLPGHQISLSTLSTKGAAGTGDTTTWDPGAIASASFASKDITVTGAALLDFALASFSLDVQDLQLDAQVTAANTVTVTLYNNTGGSVNLASGTVKVLVFKTR